MTLGELIVRLEAQPEDNEVEFDFGYLAPDGLHSWRGDYADLAIGYEYQPSGPKVAELLADLRAAVGKTFTGYKGGEFTMREDTPVHIDNYGDTSHTNLVGVWSDDYRTILLTSRELS